MMSKLMLRRERYKSSRRMVEVTVNLQSKEARVETLAGRVHLVVPCVMLTVGVHNGSMGPGLYRERETAPTVDDWNEIPVHSKHPKGRTARRPRAYNKSRIGTVFNTRWSNRRMRSEVWLDVKRTEEVEPEILEAVRNGRKVEVSTGLYLNRKRKEGVFKGEKYKWIATNQRPDHLAILLNELGACSVKKGCGLLANSRRGKCKCQKEDNPNKEIKNMLSRNRKLRMVRELIDNSGQWEPEDKKLLLGMSDKALRKVYNSAIEPDEDEDEIITTKKKVKKVAKNKDRASEREERIAARKKRKKVGNRMSSGEWWKLAPPGVKEVVQNGREMIEQRKDALIEIITNNDNNVFTEKWLKDQHPKVLEGIAQLARNNGGEGEDEEGDPMFVDGFRPDFSGAAGVVAKNRRRKDEEDEDFDDEPLEVPDLFPTKNSGDDDDDDSDDDERGRRKKSKKQRS